VIEEGLRLELTFAIDEIPHVGLWINHGGWSPGKRMKPYQNFTLQPCIGAPDTLEEALGAWKSAHWLDSGASRRWSVRWRAVPEPPLTEGVRS
jgi:hypothetical protein